MCRAVRGLNAKGVQVLLNKSADRTISHSPFSHCCLWV